MQNLFYDREKILALTIKAGCHVFFVQTVDFAHLDHLEDLD